MSYAFGLVRAEILWQLVATRISKQTHSFRIMVLFGLIQIDRTIASFVRSFVHSFEQPCPIRFGPIFRSQFSTNEWQNLFSSLFLCVLTLEFRIVTALTSTKCVCTLIVYWMFPTLENEITHRQTPTQWSFRIKMCRVFHGAGDEYAYLDLFHSTPSSVVPALFVR